MIPGTGGIFKVRADGRIVWSRKDVGRFPDVTELKRAVRDVIAPEGDLGHTDRVAADDSRFLLKKNRVAVAATRFNRESVEWRRIPVVLRGEAAFNGRMFHPGDAAIKSSRGARIAISAGRSAAWS